MKPASIIRSARPSLLILLSALVVAVPLAAQEVASVEIKPARASVIAGDATTFEAIARDSDGRIVDGESRVWLATPFDIAGADPTGRITTFRPGQVYVIALVDGVPGTAVLDIVERGIARLEIVSLHEPSEVVGGVIPLSARAYSSIGDPILRLPGVKWTSRSPQIARVEPSGLVIALAPGSTEIVAESGGVEATWSLEVRPNPVASIEIQAHTRKVRTGDVVPLTAQARTAGDEGLGDLSVRWSVSHPGAGVWQDGRFVAESPGTYLVTASIGSVAGHTSVEVIEREDPRTLLQIAHYPLPGTAQAAEIWPIGEVAYVSTIGGNVYVFDISVPSAPVLTDSLMIDARLLNDVSTTADGRIGVISREGASTRRNGLVFFDATVPQHPVLLSEFNEGMSGGVHSAFVSGQHVFSTDDATGSLRIIDFADPLNPRQVGRWEIDREISTHEIDFLNISPQRYLHDVYVEDGLAYLAYWRDGMVILDVGNGIAGGTVEAPAFVSQFRYPHSELYPPGFVAGTHAVYRYGDYVFAADESYPGTVDLTSRELFPTRGLVHVVDVSDLRHPELVARYDPGEFGAHNLYAADDVLYVAAYNGGIRILDISGSLLGNLGKQGRVIGNLYTGTLEGYRPNMALAWSAIPHRGYLYASDVNTGLWIARLAGEPIP